MNTDRAIGSSDLRRWLSEDARSLAVAHRFVLETRELLGAADATLWALTPDGAALIPAASALTRPELFAQMTTPVGDSVIGLVATSAMPTMIGPQDRHSPIAETVTRLPTTWMVAAPVFILDRLRAVLSAIQSDGARTFGRAELDAITWRAEILGLILAQLHSQQDSAFATVS